MTNQYLKRFFRHIPKVLILNTPITKTNIMISLKTNFQLIALASLVFVMAACQKENLSMTIEDLGKDYDYKNQKTIEGLYFHIPSEKVNGGNTSIRNTDIETLRWKDSPSSNGYGYFQRNRDMGQVFNVPEGIDVTVDALVLRTSLGNNAVMEGAIGAPIFVVFYEVNNQEEF